MNLAAQVAEERKLTLPNLQKEMEAEAKEFAEFTGKKPKIPNVKEIAKKLDRGPIRLAYISMPVSPQTKSLVARYMKEERTLTKSFKARIGATKQIFKAKLREIKGDIKEATRSRAGEQVLEILNHRLSAAKSIYSATLRSLLDKASREFDFLVRAYARRDPFFLQALQEHKKIRGIFRTTGKLIIFAMITTLIMIMASITIGALLGAAGSVISLFSGGEADIPEADVDAPDVDAPESHSWSSDTSKGWIAEKYEGLVEPSDMPPETKDLWDLYTDNHTSKEFKDILETNFKDSGWEADPGGKYGLIPTVQGASPDMIADSKHLIEEAFNSGKIKAPEAEQAFNLINVPFDSLVDPLEMPPDTALLWKLHQNSETPLMLKLDVYNKFMNFGYKPTSEGLVPINTDASMNGLPNAESMITEAWSSNKVTTSAAKEILSVMGIFPSNSSYLSHS